MILRTSIIISIALGISSCAFMFDTDYVNVTPVSFIPVVGTNGPRCQGWCPTSVEGATKFRVEAGRTAYRRIVGNTENPSASFIKFAKNRVKELGYCSINNLYPENETSEVNTVQGNSVYWSDIVCSKN